MAIPGEIRSLLRGEPRAHAALSCGLGGPIGETHLVAADGLQAFTRDSLIGDFTRVELDPHHAPNFEPGDFAGTLHLHLADGASVELNVSSFEREAVTRTLAAAAEPAVLPQTPPPVPAPAVPEPPAPPPPAPQANSTPTLESAAPANIEDDQAGKEPATYEGSTLRLMPCLGMLLFFFGPMVGMWFAHDYAMQALTQLSPGKREAGTFLFVITKILALVGGVYAGAKLLGWFNKFGTARNWDGRVVFDRGGVKVIGPSNKWEASIDRSRPFDLACECHAAEPQGQTDAKTEHIYYLRLTQHGDEATLRTSFHAASIEPSFAGAPVVRIGNEKEATNTLALDEKTFRRVAARLRKLHEPFAKAASTGDNGVA